MPRRARPSLHPAARVRAWFGLTLGELALYLGASQTRPYSIETGVSSAPLALLRALQPLAILLPAPEFEAATLQEIDADILETQGFLSLTTLTPTTREEKETKLAGLQLRRRKLLRPDEEVPGYTRFMADVTASQGDGQIAFLTQVLAGLVAHRATLTS